MATNKIGTVALMLTANAQGVKTGVDSAMGSIQKFFSGVGRFASRTGSIFLGNLGSRAFAAAVEGAKDLAKWAAQTAMEYEQAEIAFQVLTGTKSGGTALLGDIQKLAVETPFKSSELIAQAKLIKAYGVETEDIIKVLTQLGDVASGTGVDIGRLSLAYGQVISKGRFQATELRQFTEAGVGVAHFARQANMSMTQFLAAMEQGRIGSDIVVGAFERMTSRGGMFFQMMQKQSQTVKGRFDAFVESTEILVQKLGLAAFKSFDVAKFFDRLAKSVQGVNTKEVAEWMERASRGLEPFARGMEGLLVGGKEFAKLVMDLAPSWDELKKGFDEFVQIAIPGVINLTAEIAILIEQMRRLKNLAVDVGTAMIPWMSEGGKSGVLTGLYRGITGRGMADDSDVIKKIEETRRKALEGINNILNKKTVGGTSGTDMIAGLFGGAGATVSQTDWIQEGANKARIAGEKFAKMFNKGAEALVPGFKDIMDKLDMTMTKTPVEMFQDKLMAIQIGQAKMAFGMDGGLTEAMANKNRLAAFEDFKKLVGAVGEIRNTAPLLETRSQAAMSALNAVRAGSDATDIPGLIKLSNEKEERTAAAAEKILAEISRMEKPLNKQQIMFLGVKVAGG